MLKTTENFQHLGVTPKCWLALENWLVALGDFACF